MANAKRLLPIEALLHWAYGEQRVHLNLEGTMGRERGPNDVGDMPSGFGCLAATSDHSHPDALMLDRLVSGLETGGLVRKYGIAGTQPDWKPGARHRIEPKIWIIVSGERKGAFLETLSAPDHRYPDIAVNDCGKRKRGDCYNYCPAVEIDAPHDVMRVRAFYRDWVAGLTALRDTLLVHGDSLDEYGVTDVLPPDEPWKTPRTQRILFAQNRSLTNG